MGSGWGRVDIGMGSGWSRDEIGTGSGWVRVGIGMGSELDRVEVGMGCDGIVMGLSWDRDGIGIRSELMASVVAEIVQSGQLVGDDDLDARAFALDCDRFYRSDASDCSEWEGDDEGETWDWDFDLDKDENGQFDAESPHKAGHPAASPAKDTGVGSVPCHIAYTNLPLCLSLPVTPEWNDRERSRQRVMATPKKDLREEIRRMREKEYCTLREVEELKKKQTNVETEKVLAEARKLEAEAEVSRLREQMEKLSAETAVLPTGGTNLKGRLEEAATSGLRTVKRGRPRMTPIKTPRKEDDRFVFVREDSKALHTGWWKLRRKSSQKSEPAHTLGDVVMRLPQWLEGKERKRRQRARKVGRLPWKWRRSPRTLLRGACYLVPRHEDTRKWRLICPTYEEGGVVASKQVARVVNRLWWDLPSGCNFNMRCTEELVKRLSEANKKLFPGEEFITAAFHIKEMFCNLQHDAVLDALRWIVDFWMLQGASGMMLKSRGKEAKVRMGGLPVGWINVSFEDVLRFVEFDLDCTFVMAGGV
ncbi:hypothetical protein CBR_g50866 [Chara braunii]|uniref:Reverse transcriptase domain-containing protein n=1 Tax=Chara braunii TaxID=69332 RepID=A0A388M7T5_CHABU|nr:hypothetical protein CBR_g50866 [Chara braunii]|eukprot:GBG90522.1 hypothetical protein CBR_g50866 [Chara braunii]